MKSFFQDGRVRQIYTALTSGICMMLLGATVGWGSPFLYSVKQNKFPYNLTTNGVALIISLPDVGNIVSPIPTGSLMNWIGRKRVFFLTAIVYEISWILTIVANGANLLYVSRFLAGVAKGMSATVFPIYMAEIAETKIRGAICSLYITLELGGLLFEQILGMFISIQNLTVVSAFIPLIFFFLVITVPESPHYLLMKKNDKEAYKNYMWLRGFNEEQSENEKSSTKIELEDIRKRINQEMENRGRWIDLVNTKGNRRATIIVLSLCAMQRLSGMAAIISYLVTSLPPGFPVNPQEWAILFTTTILFTSLVSLFIIEWAGRKPTLLFCSIASAILHAVTAVYFYLDTSPNFYTKNLQFIPYITTILFGITWQVGIGTMPSTLLGELFPANIKSKAAAAANLCFSTATFASHYSYPIVTNSLGIYVMFASFSFFCVIITTVTCLFVFETKGKTLGQIQDILNKR